VNDGRRFGRLPCASRRSASDLGADRRGTTRPRWRRHSHGTTSTGNPTPAATARHRRVRTTQAAGASTRPTRRPQKLGHPSISARVGASDTEFGDEAVSSIQRARLITDDQNPRRAVNTGSGIASAHTRRPIRARASRDSAPRTRRRRTRCVAPDDAFQASLSDHEGRRSRPSSFEHASISIRAARPPHGVVANTRRSPLRGARPTMPGSCQAVGQSPGHAGPTSGLSTINRRNSAWSRTPEHDVGARRHGRGTRLPESNACSPNTSPGPSVTTASESGPPGEHIDQTGSDEEPCVPRVAAFEHDARR